MREVLEDLVSQLHRPTAQRDESQHVIPRRIPPLTGPPRHRRPRRPRKDTRDLARPIDLRRRLNRAKPESRLNLGRERLTFCDAGPKEKQEVPDGIKIRL